MIISLSTILFCRANLYNRVPLTFFAENIGGLCLYSPTKLFKTFTINSESIKGIGSLAIIFPSLSKVSVDSPNFKLAL